MKLDHRRAHLWATVGITTIAVFVASPEKANAALMHAGASYQAHKSLGVANSNDVLWVESEFNGTAFGFSAIRLNDSFAITVGHGVFSTFAGVVKPQRVGNGTNYLTDRGVTTGIAEVIVYPSYAGAQDTSFSTPDIAIIRFSDPVAGVNPVFGNSTTVGEVLVSAGFGDAGFVGGSFTVTGDLLGWNAPILSETSASFNRSYYGHTWFNPSNGVIINGRGSNRDSGSPVYNSLGQLVGMTVGTNPTAFVAQATGSTIFLDLTNPVMRAWIGENTAIPVPPKIMATIIPPAIILTFADLIPSREYRIMWSSTLTGWEEASRFTSAGTTGSWSESLAHEGRRFYKLEWNE